MTDLAKIGFAAETAPLKVAADDVQAFGDKAEKAGDQVEKANEKFAKGKESASGMGAGMKEAGAGAETAAGSIKSISSSIDASSQAVQKATGFWKNFTDSFKSGFNDAVNQSKTSLQNYSGEVAKAGTVTQQIDSIVAKTGVSYGEAARQVAGATIAQAASREATIATATALTTATGSTEKHTIASKALGTEHKVTSEVTKGLREAVHTLEPALEAAGVRMASLTQYSGAARAGLVALGVAVVGGVALELAKMGDEAEKARIRLQGLVGLKRGEEYTQSLKSTSKELGIATNAVAPAYEALLKLANLKGPQGGVQILGPGLPEYFDSTKFSADGMRQSIEAVFEQLKLGGASTKEATAATNAFFVDVAKNGEMTGNALRKLEQVAPRAAQSITNAMTGGKLNAEQYAAALDKAPLSIQKLMEMLPRLAAGSAAAFKEMEEHPKTLEGAVDKLTKSFEELWKKITGDSLDSSATKVISSLADRVNYLEDRLDESKKSADDWSGGWLDILKKADSEGSASMGSMVTSIKNFNADGSEQLRIFNESAIKYLNIREGVAALSSGLAQADSDIINFAASANASFARMAQGAISAAQTAAAALAGIAKGGGGSGAYNTDAMGNPTGGGGGGANDNFGYSGNQSAGYLPPSGDAGTINYGDLGGGDIPGFATGGSFMVGGDGGTDSQLVQFKASPWETVTVSGGTGPDSSSTASGSSVGAGLLQGGPGTATTSVGQPDAVKQITDAISTSTDDISKQVLTGSDQIVTALNKLLGSGGTGTSSSVVGAAIASSAIGSSVASSGASSSSSSGSSGGASLGSIKNGSDPFNAWGVKETNEQTTKPRPYSPFNSGMVAGRQGVVRSSRSQSQRQSTSRSPVNPNYNGGLNSYGMPGFYGTNYDSSGDFNGSISDYDYGMSNSYGTNYDGSGDLYGSISDYGYGQSDFYGADYGGSGNFSGSISDVGMTDILTGGNDTGAMDYGGGSIDAGYFADGGSFEVPGGGGVDSQTITMHARPGEQVTVETPEQRKAGSGSNDRPITVNQYFTGDSGNQNSSMSRAQTQRMIRGALVT